MEIDIYCEDLKCPICGSKLDNILFRTFIRCVNNCYDMNNINVDYGEINISVFGKKFIITNKEQKLIQEVINEINYWKENDRYLIRIMVRE